MPIRQPTADEISALQIETGEGRMVCNRELKMYFTRLHVQNATTVEELREALLTLLPGASDWRMGDAIKKVIHD